MKPKENGVDKIAAEYARAKEKHSEAGDAALFNHELARLAACLTIPAHLREHDISGDQLPRQFPRLHKVVKVTKIVVEDAASHRSAVKKDEELVQLGMPSDRWKPMEGEFTPEKRIE